MKSKKRMVLLLTILVMTIIMGCSEKTGSNQNSDLNMKSNKTFEFVDSAGRKVTLSKSIKRIAPSGTMAQIMLFALAPDEMVGLSGKWATSAELVLDKKYLELPVFGQFYGSKDLNMEALVAADPQVIIDIGEAKDSIAADMDQMSEQLGIPTVFIEATTEGTGDAYRMLGKLLGKEEDAEEIAVFCDNIYDLVKDQMNQITEKKKILYCLGTDGLNVIGEQSFHSEVLNMIGDNVAKLDQVSSLGSGNPVSMEQILKWNPEYIIFAPGSIYSQVEKNPSWQGLSAIQSKKYFEAPSIPYNWLGFPPSVNRYIGMIWLCETLYPNDFDFDLYGETKQFYEMFYHCDMTEELFEKITNPSK